MKRRPSYLVLLVVILSTGCGSFFDRDQIEIKKVIRWYDEALVKAYTQLDVKPLDGLASEREMTRVNMMLVKFQRENKVMESEIKELKFVKISVSPEGRADVETEEKWRYRFLRKGTDRAVTPWTDVDYRMGYEMVKSKGQWLVGLTKINDTR